jgi:hypothetical protein
MRNDRQNVVDLDGIDYVDSLQDSLNGFFSQRSPGQDVVPL